MYLGVRFSEFQLFIYHVFQRKCARFDTGSFLDANENPLHVRDDRRSATQRNVLKYKDYLKRKTRFYVSL